jgi:hypothetical protein
LLSIFEKPFEGIENIDDVLLGQVRAILHAQLDLIDAYRVCGARDEAEYLNPSTPSFSAT